MLSFSITDLSLSLASLIPPLLNSHTGLSHNAAWCAFEGLLGHMPSFHWWKSGWNPTKQNGRKENFDRISGKSERICRNYSGFVEIILGLSEGFVRCSGFALCFQLWMSLKRIFLRIFLHTNNRLLLQWTKFVNPSARISVFTSSGGYPGGGINRFRPRSLEIVFISQQMPFKLDTD